MSLHKAEITSRVKAYLNRFTPPRGMIDNPSAQADQIAAYVRILSGYAPQDLDALNEFWARFENEMSQYRDTWAWPAEGHVGKAAKAAAPIVRVNGSSAELDVVEVNLKRLNDGGTMAEDWLWGRNALRLVAAGADRETMRQRRVQFARHMAGVYPADMVRAKLADLRIRHERAEAEMSDWQVGQRRQRDSGIPDKRAFTDAELEGMVA